MIDSLIVVIDKYFYKLGDSIMAFIDKNGNAVQPGALAAWVQSLPEPQRTEYETIRQEGVQAGHETEAFVRIWAEFATAAGLVNTPSEG